MVNSSLNYSGTQSFKTMKTFIEFWFDFKLCPYFLINNFKLRWYKIIKISDYYNSNNCLFPLYYSIITPSYLLHFYSFASFGEYEPQSLICGSECTPPYYFRCEDTRIKVLNNQSVINGASLKAVVDPENLVALIMNDLE